MRLTRIDGLSRIFASLLLVLILGFGIAIQPGKVSPAAASISDPSHQPKEFEHVKDVLLVKFRDGVSENEKRAAVSQNFGQIIDQVPQTHLTVIKVPEFLSDYVESRLQSNNLVDYVEKDYLFSPQMIPNDPQANSAWHLELTNTYKAFDVAKGNGVTIAILDTGVQPDHPDLVDKLVPSLGYNFWLSNSDWSDRCSHGTAVAGIAAASTNNTVGVVGAAWNSKILPLKVTDDIQCMTSSLTLIRAITYAADNGAKVVNISFGINNGGGLTDAAKYLYDKGGWVVAAGGNDPVLVDQPDNPYIISVSATDGMDSVTNISTWGPYIDFAAPGSGSPTTFLGSSYGWMGGSSSSSPLMSGIIALMFSANPSASPQQVYDALKKSSVDLGSPGYDYHYGWGRPDAFAAVQYITGKSGDFVPPHTNISSAVDGFGNTISSGDTFTPNGKTTSTSMTFSFTGTDNVGITGFECMLDSSVWSSCASSTTITNLVVGDHTFYVKAVDTSANIDMAGDMWQFSVVTEGTDVIPPTLVVNSPVQGQTMTSSSVSISGTASDNDVIQYVQISVDGGPYYPATGTSTWTITKNYLADGTHVAVAKAVDASNNVGYSSTIDFSVQTSQITSSSTSNSTTSTTTVTTSDQTPPSVTIVSPASGSTVKGQVTISASASDNSGISKVEFYINNVLKKSLTTAPFDQTWNTKGLKNGTYTIMVIAYDSSGNKASASENVRVANGNK